MYRSRFITYFFIIALFACSSDDETTITPTPSNPTPSNSDWLIPIDQILDGGPGKDGIPSIDDPQFTKASEITFMNDDWLVTGIVHDGKIKAYPHPILDWHEIVNDEIGSLELAITYCPLTGTGIGWDRNINGQVTTFGVSGLLYNTNLMPYDRLTNSTWSQQRLDCVNGELIGNRINTYSLVETTWKTWKSSFPESEVLNTNTGHNRSYGNYPYGDYRSNNTRILFPISNEDNRLPNKERVLGVFIGDQQKVYTFQPNSIGIELLEDQLSITDLIIIRSVEHNFIIAFTKLPGTEYSVVNNNFPYILENQDGVQYNILGIPDSNGAPVLQLPEQFIGYWFSWGTFYPDIDIYEE